MTRAIPPLCAAAIVAMIWWGWPPSARELAWTAATDGAREVLRSPRSAVFQELPATDEPFRLGDSYRSAVEPPPHWFVSDLHPPSTGNPEWDKLPQLQGPDPNERWLVAGWLDSDNAYGASLRGQFVVFLIEESPGCFTVEHVAIADDWLDACEQLDQVTH